MANSGLLKNIRSGIIVLGLFASVTTGLVVLVHQLTEERVAANERAAVLRSLHALVPSDRLDNDLYHDAITVRDPELLGAPDGVMVYRARKQGLPVATIFNVVAPDGYSGPIALLVAVTYAGEVMGVRVVGHKETPGLGDKIEERRTPWLHGFERKNLQDPPLVSGWGVRRDGGAFDQFSGATITPRAVVKAVKNTLVYYSRHRDELFAAPSAKELAP
ncbi:MAG: electron transport complex subunit RsxG [Pseudomonadota bacterium]